VDAIACGTGNEEERQLGILGMLEDGIEPPTKLVFGGRLAPYLMFFAIAKLVGAT
jgi:hypothetical protein